MAAVELQLTSLRDDANLLSYYRFEGNSNDELGNDNGTDTQMTYNNTNPLFNQNALFNGNSNGSHIVLNSVVTTAKTVMVWVYLTSNAGLNADGNFIVFQGSSFYLGFNSSLDPEYFVSTWKAGNTAVTLNVWHLVTLTSDGSGTNLYLDITNILNNADASIIGNLQYIGERPDSTVAPAMYLGRMDDASFFSRVLTSTEISNYYNGNLPVRGGHTLTANKYW